MWPSVALKVLPYIAAAALGAFAMRYVDSLSYSRLQAKFSQYQAQVAQANAASEKAAREAEEQRTAERLAAEDRNTVIIEGLKHENLSVSAAHAGAERVLAAACKADASSGNHPVPATSDKPAALDTPESQGARRLAADLGASAIEARSCIEQLRALQAEIIPQLRVP